MEFLKYIDNKNIITEAFTEVLEPVNEGWGIKLTQSGYILGWILIGSATFPFFGALKRLGIGMALVGINGKLGSYQSNLSKDVVKKIMSAKEVKEYLSLAAKSEIEKIKKFYKDDKNIKINNVPGSHAIRENDTYLTSRINKRDIPKKYPNNRNINALGYIVIDIHDVPGFELICYADTNHIEAVSMRYGIKFKTSDGKSYEIYRTQILPSPTEENIKKLGYKQEDND